QRADTDAGLLRYPRHSEALRPFLRQNLNCRLQSDRDELGRARLLRLFSRGNRCVSMAAHGRMTMRIANMTDSSHSSPALRRTHTGLETSMNTPVKTPDNTLTTAPLAPLLERLFEEAAKATPSTSPVMTSFSPEERARLMRSKTDYLDFYARLKDLPLPISRETGTLLYMLARSGGARTIVEFGTSFAISTLHLAAALRDNGGGRLITTEFEPSKVARARDNLTAGGVMDLVEIRVGDALKTLSVDLPESIDLLLLDGAKG